MLKTIHILLFLLFFATTFAQEPIHYTTKQGLPTNHIYDIKQDSNGFMWFGTNRGVVKYDGETFKTFTIKDGLPNNDIWYLETDTKGRVWYFSKSKYQGYIKKDSIYKFPIKEGKVISPGIIHKENDKISIHNSVGLHTLKDSVFVSDFSFEDYFNRFKKYKMKYPFLEKDPFYIPESDKYIGLSEKNIIIIDEIKKEDVVIPLSFSSKNSISLGHKIMPNNKLFISFKEGFVFVDLKTYKAKQILFKDIIGQDKVEQIRCNPLQKEVQISGPGYFMLFDYNFNLLKSYIFPETEKSVWSYQDTDGNIWQNSLNKGITLILNTQLKTNYFLKDKKTQKIGAINNAVFTGIENDGFYEFNNKIQIFEKRKDLISNGIIYHIKNDFQTKTNYLVSANNSYEIINDNFSPIKLFINFGGYSAQYANWFKDVVRHNDTYYFVDSRNFALCNPISQHTNVISKSGLQNLIVFNNTIYMAGSDGLSLFKNDSIVKPKLKSNLLDVPINYIVANKTNLLVGTDGRGVYYFNENELVHLKNTDGLIIEKIIEKDNNIWLATNEGVKKIEKDSIEFSNSKIIDAFYEEDGLLQSNTNDIYVDNNYLYVATDIGISKVNLSSEIYKKPPELYFKTEKDTLIFTNGSRDFISISFSALEYVNQEYLTYQYRLLPSQKQWITTQAKTLNFSNLSPKLYTIEVKATDQHNNTKIKKQYLDVIPAWWQTKFNKIMAPIFLFLCFLLLFNEVKSRIRKKEQNKAEQEKKVAGLELQALRSQMNPHFVHNSLNAIQYFIQRNEVELSENYLSKFSQLIRLFFEYSRRQNITIKEELELLKNYLDIEKLRFEDKLNYTIKVCDAIDTEDQIIPSMLLQPIVENAVNHGLFHKTENGNVNITFKYIDALSFKVIVEDDGIGINKSKAMYSKSSKNYQSSSSMVLYERLELLNQSKEWDINYNIEDLSETDASKSGTQVTLFFKQLK